MQGETLLRAGDRAAVLARLHEARFIDLPPAQVCAQVLDAGQVPRCSIELLATGPDQVWSWDITKILGPNQVDLLPPRRPRWAAG